MTALQVQRESPLVCINCDRLSSAVRCVTLRGWGTAANDATNLQPLQNSSKFSPN